MSNDDCEIIYSQSNLESIRADYEKQLSFIKKQLDEAKAYCSKKDQTISELQMQLDKLSLELDDKKDEFSLINRKTKEIQDLQAQAREKTEKAEKDLHKAYVELTQVQDRNLSLTTENKKFIELVAAQKKDIEKSNEMIKKLTSENAALRTELAKKNPNVPVMAPPKPAPVQNNNKLEEVLVNIKKNLKTLHEATKVLFEDVESRLEVLKFLEVDKKNESLKKAYEGDLIEVRDKLKEILFFKDIAEGALI